MTPTSDRIEAKADPHKDRLAARAGRFLKRLRSVDRQIALLEQCVLATLRLGAVIIFARILPPEIFGAFALVISISFIINNGQRSLVILPFILASQRAGADSSVGHAWWWIDVATAAIVAVLLLSATALLTGVGGPEWLIAATLFSALSAPPLMAYTFMRRWSYQTRNHRNILVMLIAHILGYGIGIGLAVLYPDVHVLPFLAFAAGPIAGCLAGLIVSSHGFGKPPTGLFGQWRGSFHFTAWSFLSFLCGTVYTNGMNILVAGVLGPVSSALFAASRALVAPAVSITSAVDLIDKPRAGRAYAAGGLAKLRKSIRSTLATLLFLGVPYLALVSVFSDQALVLLYGDKYPGLGFEVRLWAIAMFLQMVANPLATQLVTLANARSMFVSSLVAAIVTLCVALPLFDSLGLAAALIAMICGRLASVILLFLATRRAIGRPLQLQGTATSVDTS